MSDCISLIDNGVPFETVCSWSQVSQMTNIEHTEEVDIISVAGGYLDIEVFCVANLDCRVIGSMVYHCCATGAIHSMTDQPICHLFQEGPDTCVKLDCWDLSPKQKTTAPVYTFTADPCARLSELRACQFEWLKAGRKTNWTMRDASGTTQFLSEKCLKELIAQAEAECDMMCGVNSRCVTYTCRGFC